MVRPKKEGRKVVKRTVSIDPDLFDWIEEKLEERRFGSLSHAVNEALMRFKEELK